MATMPAASVLGEDGGRSAGEVAPGVTLVKNVRIPVRDGTRLAADIYMSRALRSRQATRSRSSWSTSRTARTKSLPGTASTSTSRSKATPSPASTSAAQWRLAGHDARRVPAAGAARRRRLRRVVRRRRPWCTGPREHDGHLVRRIHDAADREPRARASDEHHPDVLHGRPLHGRLPFPRRPDAQVLRRQPLRQHDGRLERAATVSGVVGRLGGGVGGAPRRKRALPARVVPPPDRRPTTGANGSVGDARSRSCAARRS